MYALSCIACCWFATVSPLICVDNYLPLLTSSNYSQSSPKAMCLEVKALHIEYSLLTITILLADKQKDSFKYK